VDAGDDAGEILAGDCPDLAPGEAIEFPDVEHRAVVPPRVEPQRALHLGEVELARLLPAPLHQVRDLLQEGRDKGWVAHRPGPREPEPNVLIAEPLLADFNIGRVHRLARCPGDAAGLLQVEHARDANLEPEGFGGPLELEAPTRPPRLDPEDEAWASLVDDIVGRDSCLGLEDMGVDGRLLEGDGHGLNSLGRIWGGDLGTLVCLATRGKRVPWLRP
jgi:hypothetical protein